MQMTAKSELIRNPYILFFTVIFIAHYINRTVIYPLRIPTNAKQQTFSLVNGLLGLAFQAVNCYLIFVSFIY